MARFRQPEEAKLESLLRGSENLDWLKTFVLWHVRDRLLPTLAFSDAKPVAGRIIANLCVEVSSAVIVRLRRKYPAGASRPADALVRSYPKPVARLLDLQLSVLTDLWCSDLVAHPDDTLAARYLRLVPGLRSAVSRRGKARRGENIELARLAAFDEALSLIPNKPKRANAYGSIELGELSKRWGKSLDLDVVRRLSKREIAKRFAARAFGDLPEITPGRFGHMLPALRRAAAALDVALASVPD